MTIIGYQLSAHDNGDFMFDDPSVVPACAVCGNWFDQEPTNANYLAGKSNVDAGYTYDGQLIVSSAFRDVCLTEGYEGLEFRGFDRSPGHHHLLVERQVAFDAERRGTRFEGRCDRCGAFNDVVGASPCFLKQSEPLRDGFWRTDLMFASGNEKAPLVLVSTGARDKLRAAGLRGLEFHPVYGLAG